MKGLGFASIQKPGDRILWFRVKGKVWNGRMTGRKGKERGLPCPAVMLFCKSKQNLPPCDLRKDFYSEPQFSNYELGLKIIVRH